MFLRLLLWIPLLPFSRGSPEDLPSQRAAPVLSNPIPSLLCPLFPLFLQSALWFGLPCTNPQPLSAVRACGTLRGWYSQANPSILVPRKQPSLEATSKCPFSWDAKMSLFLYPPLSPKDVSYLCPAVCPPPPPLPIQVYLFPLQGMGNFHLLGLTMCCLP